MASYDVNEITQMLSEISVIEVEIKPYLAWMFIKIKSLHH